MSGPCASALAASRLAARRWQTRVELFALLEQGRLKLAESPADAPIDVAADAATMSKYHFARHFREAYGETPRAYQRRCLVQRAQSLLAEGHPVGHVAVELGFAGPRTFARMIRRETGVSPRQHAKASQ